MTYKESLDYLLKRLPMFQRVGKVAFKKDLGNTLAFCKALDNPQHAFRSIHVAGTNGKGSVSSMLASVLKEAGYKTGLYTSPHLKSFTERIRINGEEVKEAFVAKFVTDNQQLIEAINPSYFETTVAMAFDYFTQEQVDVAVVEVGLGGRLDSTNVLLPELSVITNIGWDHMDLLGDSLELIAGEKAGIIKPRTPVIIGETQEETNNVFIAKAESEVAPIIFADQQQVLPIRISGDWQQQRFSYEGEQDIHLDLSGRYQQKNLATALSAIQVLQIQGWDISPVHIRQGLQKVKVNSGLRGRMEVLQGSPLILADTAHNANGLTEVIHQLMETNPPQVGVVLGMVSEKDHDAVLELFPKEAKYFFVRPDVPRGLNAFELQEKAAFHGLKGEVFDTVQDGLMALRTWLKPSGLGFVGGSTFTVAEVV